MATSQELDRLKSAYRNYLGREASGDELSEGSGIGVEDSIRKLLGSSEYLNRQAGRVHDEYQPELSSLARDETRTTSEYDDLISQLESRQKELPEEVFGDFNRRGLFRSSIAQNEVAKQVGDIAKRSSTARADRASRLADFAAARANLMRQRSTRYSQLVDADRGTFEQELERLRQQQEQLRASRAAAASQSSTESLLASLLGGNQGQVSAGQAFDFEDLPELPTAQYGQAAGPARPAATNSITSGISASRSNLDQNYQALLQGLKNFATGQYRSPVSTIASLLRR